jgi:hypothetical protein
MGKPAIFLDRDGTLIEDRGPRSDPAQVLFYPGPGMERPGAVSVPRTPGA